VWIRVSLNNLVINPEGKMGMKAALAELIGTLTLVFVGTATAVFAASGIPALFTRRAR
jgi:glycerol uptake facilitator-like aquaporin